MSHEVTHENPVSENLGEINVVLYLDKDGNIIPPPPTASSSIWG